VPLEHRDVLRRPRPLRLEAQQERAGGGGQLDRRADQRVDDLDVGGIRGCSRPSTSPVPMPRPRTSARTNSDRISAGCDGSFGTCARPRPAGRPSPIAAQAIMRLPSLSVCGVPTRASAWR